MLLEKKTCSIDDGGLVCSPPETKDVKNFHISEVDRNILTDYLPERDNAQTFAADMYNFGEEDNLPDSDRIMECQIKGISQKKCLDI